MHLPVCSGQKGRRSSAPDDEVDGGGARVEKHDTVGHKREGVPEVHESATLLKIVADVELGGGGAIQPEHRYRNHACRRRTASTPIKNDAAASKGTNPKP